MLTDETSGVSSCRACFRTETRRIGCIIYRQFCFRHDFLRTQVGDRNFRRRDEEEVFLRNVEHILFKFRQLACSCHSRPVDHKRRQDLNIILIYGMQVEHEVDDSSLKSGSQLFIYGESGA